MRCLIVLAIFLFSASSVEAKRIKRTDLEPDFMPQNLAGRQVYREELAKVLSNIPGYNINIRDEYRQKAEKLIVDLYKKGKKKYHLPKQKIDVAWDYFRPTEIAYTQGECLYEDCKITIHLNEILFFAQHDDFIKAVIPHEVAHVVYFLRFGDTNENHDLSFYWVAEKLSPEYKYKEIDISPACRLVSKLFNVKAVSSYDTICINGPEPYE